MSDAITFERLGVVRCPLDMSRWHLPEGKGVKGEKVGKNTEKEKESGRNEKFKLETQEEIKVRTTSVKKFFLRTKSDNSVRKTGKLRGIQVQWV